MDASPKTDVPGQRGAACQSRHRQLNRLAGAWISNAATGNPGIVAFTLQGTMGVNSFQLVQRPLIPNGRPNAIIVEGGP